ncbi:MULTISPECIES: hypothetical protein [unclassified Pseudovibrio]|uniref:hypothetical protein n=1 Tax=unclassified Pseudovibrio TaxID=2627060 RepID=UPI0007AEB661|nr:MULTISPECIES: hypothetical protein [unclassified Pseudovibrio]KZL15709.1 hypothetical protein PsAD37_04286 [Pseudovibrio sp. Ad37]KZL23671.1 hypothetical protein PsWM33_02959 [Pseudovibrio sp. WM33]
MIRLASYLSLCFYSLFMLSACGSQGDTAFDVSREADTTWLVKILKEKYSEYRDTRYFLKWFDLNGDGESEAIVYIIGPVICGSGGCNTLVFDKSSGEYKQIAELTVTQPPILASEDLVNGWSVLVSQSYGGGAVAGYSEYTFRGKAYPNNASQIIGVMPRGTILIPEISFFKEGVALFKN